MGDILPSSSFAVPEIPSATGIISNSTRGFMIWIIFSKGPYLTVIATQGSEKSEGTAVRDLAINLAVAEYHLLPT